MTPEPQDEILSDSSKACLSLFYLVCAVILPFIGFLIGWQGWDLKTGGLVALATFGVFILFSGLFIAIIRSPSWVMVFTPILIGILYAAFPDPILGPIDDVAMNLGGALATFILWVKKQPYLPRWVVIPLLATAAYAAVGYFIPGPIDEVIVSLIAVAVAGIGASTASPEDDETAAPADPDPHIIDATFADPPAADLPADPSLAAPPPDNDVPSVSEATPYLDEEDHPTENDDSDHRDPIDGDDLTEQ